MEDKQALAHADTLHEGQLSVSHGQAVFVCSAYPQSIVMLAFHFCYVNIISDCVCL